MRASNFAFLMQSGLSLLVMSSADAGATSPQVASSPRIVAAPPLVRLAQNAPERNAPNIPNAANVSVQMFPEQTAGIGSKVSFRVTTRKPGYIMLVDIDARGRMSQIFPSPELIAQSDEAAMNYIKPGEEMQLPNSAAKKRGFEYVATPPVGAAAVVAILSDRKVQILDLPDTAQQTRSEAETLNFLTQWTSQLRVPDPGTGKLQRSNWSFDIKRYQVQ
jgi:hypothetical protein